MKTGTGLLLTLLTLISPNTYAQDNNCTGDCQRIESLIEADANIGLINKVWIKPETLKNQCDEFAYFPDSGILSAYCFIKTWTPVSVLEKISGHKVFLTSPHKNDSIIKTTEKFGHYNPEFLIWGIKNILPITNSNETREIVKQNYKTYISNSAKIYYMVYLRLQQKNAENTKIRNYIIESITNKKSYDIEEYFEYLDNSKFGRYPISSEQNGVNGNIVKTAVPFWIRRELDKTDHLFIQAMEKVFVAYEPDFLRYAEDIVQD